MFAVIVKHDLTRKGYRTTAFYNSARDASGSSMSSAMSPYNYTIMFEENVYAGRDVVTDNLSVNFRS